MFVSRDALKPEQISELVERRIMAYDDQLMLVEMRMRKGSIGALHTHPHHQVDYLVSGCIEFELEGEKQVLCPGDSVVIPPHAWHGAIALEDSVVLDIFSPLREDFLAPKE